MQVAPNLEPMQVAFFLLAGEITQVKEAIPWVRCASGNVLHYEHKKIRSTISVHFSDQTKKAKLPEMAKLTRIQPVPVMGTNL